MTSFFAQYQKFFLRFFLSLLFLEGIFVGYSYLDKYVFPRNLEVVFPQIDRGDSIYIRTPSRKEIIIDGGQNISTLVALEKYRPFWDRHLDLLIITHPDSDHYYGFLDILERFSVDNIMMTGVKKDDPQYQKIFKMAREKNINLLYADKDRDFMVDGVFFDVLSPFHSLLGMENSAGNNNSLVIKMIYKGKSILFTGDIEQKTEEKLLASGVDVHADILKVPHHGSHSSSSEYFLEAVTPSRAIFTTGTKNTFGHPHKDTLDRYRRLNIPFVNARDGDVVLDWGDDF